MSKFKVDNEQVNATVETLKKLLKECEDLYDKDIPTSDVDKGKTHEELVTVCDNIRTTCYYFGQLIHNTIEFLGKSSEMFEMSDKTSADAIKDEGGSTTHTSSSGNTHGGGGASLGGAEESGGNNNTPTFEDNVNTLKNKEGFKHGTAWGWEGTYVGNYTASDGQTYPINGKQCFAMAFMMQAELMHKRGYSTGLTGERDIQIGDVVQLSYSKPGDYATDHWVFVTDVTDTGIVFADGNHWSPNGQIVTWDNVLTFDQISGVSSICR